MSTELPTVIVVDIDGFVDTSRRLLDAITDARMFATLPFVLAAPGDPGLATVASIPGVLGIVPGDRLTLNILDGLDRVGRLCLGQNDAWSVGGVTDAQHYPYLFEESHGTAAPPAVCAAVNLSLAPLDDAFAPTLPDDVVNNATRAIAGLTLPIVATGNGRRPEYDFETVSPWAEPTWVLSVGATSDAAGEIEYPLSGRDTPSASSVGPDILTWGRDLSSDWMGTSFAAARTSNMAVLCRAWLLQVVATLDRAGGRPFGVPLVGAAIIDRGIDKLPAPDIETAALPMLDPSPAALAGAPVAILDELVTILRGNGAVAATKQLLLAAAAATTPTTTLSAPSLTPTRLEQFLDELTLTGLRRILGLTPAAAAPTDAPLFPTDTTRRLRLLVEASMPLWGWDIGTRTSRQRPGAEK